MPKSKRDKKSKLHFSLFHQRIYKNTPKMSISYNESTEF